MHLIERLILNFSSLQVAIAITARHSQALESGQRKYKYKEAQIAFITKIHIKKVFNITVG